VRSEETVCPFCAAALAATPAASLPFGRFTRAAVFAGALAGTAIACGGGQSKPKGPEQGTADAGVTEEVPPPDHDVPMPYGAPPVRDRVV